MTAQEQQMVGLSSRNRDGQNNFNLLCTGAAVVFAAAFWLGLHDFRADRNSLRAVELTQTTSLSPHNAWLPDDDLAGVRPGQSLRVAKEVFRNSYWGYPYETEAFSRSATVSSKPYVDELWDIDNGDGGVNVAYVHLTSPSSGNVVYSTTQANEFNGAVGYPNFADIQASLIKKYGAPTDRIQWGVHPGSGETLTLVWVRGGGDCDCKYLDKMKPKVGSARTLKNSGLPVAPVIVANIDRVEGNRDKVKKLILRLTDYSIIAKANEADVVALEIAEAEYGNLPEAGIKF